ncbi:MAG: 2OG-Fe(II) oxygenase family protein [Gammaproteobacteria bacterium]
MARSPAQTRNTPRNAPRNDSGIRQLWPVSILTRQFPEHAQVNPELITLFRQYRREHPRAPGSVYASADNFAEDLDNAALSALKKFILDNVFAIAAEVNAPYWKQGMQVDVKLTGMWFQITNDSAFHEVHVHGNCSWSGVYYVQSGDCSRSRGDTRANGMPNGITRFYGPQMEYLAGGHGDRGNYYLNDHAYDCYPQDGKLCVFPSHLKHMAFPYQGRADRIIVSFHAVVDAEEELRYGYSFG